MRILNIRRTATAVLLQLVAINIEFSSYALAFPSPFPSENNFYFDFYFDKNSGRVRRVSSQERTNRADGPGDVPKEDNAIHTSENTDAGIDDAASSAPNDRSEDLAAIDRSATDLPENNEEEGDVNVSESISSDDIESLIAPSTYDEYYYSEFPASDSEEAEIQRMLFQISDDYLDTRDELCPVCFLVVAREGRLPVEQRQMLKATNTIWWRFASVVMKHLREHPFLRIGAVQSGNYQALCSSLVSDDMKRRIMQRFYSTRYNVKKDREEGLDSTSSERRHKAYEIFTSSLDSRIEDYYCEADYTQAVARLERALRVEDR